MGNHPHYAGGTIIVLDSGNNIFVIMENRCCLVLPCGYEYDYKYNILSTYGLR